MFRGSTKKFFKVIGNFLKLKSEVLTLQISNLIAKNGSFDSLNVADNISTFEGQLDCLKTIKAFGDFITFGELRVFKGLSKVFEVNHDGVIDATGLNVSGLGTFNSLTVGLGLTAEYLEIGGRVECNNVEAPNGCGAFNYLSIGDEVSDFNGQVQFNHSVSCANTITAEEQITSFKGLNVFHDGNNVFDVDETGAIAAKSLSMLGVDLHGSIGMGVAVFDITGRVKALDVVSDNLATEDSGTQRFKVGKDGKVSCRGLSIYHEGWGDNVVYYDGDNGNLINVMGSFVGNVNTTNLTLNNLATVDPHTEGLVWVDSGTLKVSAG